MSADSVLNLNLSPRQDPREVARTAAVEFVAGSFLKPVFKAMRESPFADDLAPGAASTGPFAELLDAELARKIAASGRFPLVDDLASALQSLRQRGSDRVDLAHEHATEGNAS